MDEKRGKIIVIEGTDASGKGTQTLQLYECLKEGNVPCERMGFPRYETPTGNIIGVCYLGKPPKELSNPNLDLTKVPDLGSWFKKANDVDPKLASGYYALDRYAALPEINSKLEKGINLIMDRYVESNMGHQGGKIRDPQRRREFYQWIDQLEYGHLGLPRPDLVMFLYMPREVAAQLKKGRPGKADSHESDPEHLKNAEEAYLQLADMFGWRKLECAPDKTMKSLRSVDDIHKEIFREVIKIL